MTYKINLEDAFKQFTLDQDKIMSPEQTIQHFKDKIKKLNLNILEEVKRIDNGRLDIPVYFSVCGHDAKAMTGTNKQMGKGATPQQAEASAVMELAERFSFFSFCKNPDNFFTEKYSNIKENAIDFEMIAKSVHDDSDDLEISKKIFDELPLQWTKSYNLTQDRESLIPFNWFFMINEFNGPSAGNCVEEAVSQGICEIVERHVSSLISQNKIKVPLIDPQSSKDPMVQEMLKKYNKAGIELYLSDFSMDTGIPSVGVLAWDPASYPETSEIVWTAGTTPDPEKALSRALTETAQLAGDFNSGSNYVASGLPKFNNLKNAEYITFPGQTISIQELPDLSNNNIKIEIKNLVEALKKNEMEVFLIDTEHEKLGIPAFYTIIPGAHFRERALRTSVGMFSAKMITESLNPADAVTKLTEINKILPGKYYIQFYKGTSFISMGKPDKALDHFEKALDLNPTGQDIAGIYSYMGICLKDMEQYRKALEVLRIGKKYDHERTDIHNLMGFCHFRLKEHEEAIECFRRVIELDPSSAIDYANIASNYRDMGKTELAILHYKLALAIDPNIEFAKDYLRKIGLED